MIQGLRRFYAVIAVLAVAMTAAGLAMLPSVSERLEMYYQSSEFDRAAALIEASPNKSSSIARAVAEAKVFFSNGDITAAINALKSVQRNGRLSAQGVDLMAYYYGQNNQLAEKNRVLLGLIHDYLTEEDARSVMDFFRAYAMPEEHLIALEAMHARGFATATEQLELARTYRHEGRAQDALSILEGMFEGDLSGAGPLEAKTLALLMQRAERGDEVGPLLSRWMASNAQAEGLADRLSLVHDFGLYELVVDSVASRRYASDVYADYYESALFQLKDGSLARRGQYRDWLLERLPDLQGVQAKREMIFRIFDLATSDKAYEAIRASGLEEMHLARDIYYGELEREGRTQELTNLLFEDFRSTSSLRQRLRQADRMASLGAFGKAESAYRDLSEHRGVRNEALKSLTYVWGRLGKTPDIDWLGRGLLSASRSDYPTWEEAFLNAASAGELLDWLERQPPPADLTDLAARTRVTLALWEPGAPRLEAAMIAVSQLETLPAATQHDYLQAACANGATAPAWTFIDRLSRAGEATAPLHLCAARLASDVGDHEEAIYHYDQAEGLGAQASLDDLWRFARATEHVGGKAEAASLYHNALNRLPPVQVASARQNEIRGYLYMGLDDLRRAAASFEIALQASDPVEDELALRKTVMEVYITLQDYEGALRHSCRTERACAGRPPEPTLP